MNLQPLGTVRKLDGFGRLVIPKEARDRLGIDLTTPLELLLTADGRLVIQRYAPGCEFCGRNVDDGFIIGGKKICHACGEKLKGEIA